MKINPNRIIAGDCIKILSDLDEPIADLIFADPPFNIGYDYDVYKDSLKALSQLDVEVLCTGHQLIFTGLDARKHIQWSLNQAADYVAMVERLLREEDGEVERVVARIKAEKWDPKPLPKQPERAYVMNTEIRVNIILERMKKRK